MIESRRNFLTAAAALAVSACGAGLLAAQGPEPGFPPPTSGPPLGPGFPFPDRNGPLDEPVPTAKKSTAQQMKENQAEIEKDMVRLKAAVAELEKEFNSNDTKKVLSMAAIHKTEEIEKLAKHIRGLVHG
jgi:hypothetical protein